MPVTQTWGKKQGIPAEHIVDGHHFPCTSLREVGGGAVGRHQIHTGTLSGRLGSATLSTGDKGQSDKPHSSWVAWTCHLTPLNLIYFTKTRVIIPRSWG